MRYEIVKPIDEEALAEFEKNLASCKCDFWKFLKDRGHIREVPEFKVGQWFTDVNGDKVLLSVHHVNLCPDTFGLISEKGEVVSFGTSIERAVRGHVLTPISPPVFGEEVNFDTVRKEYANDGWFSGYLAENFRLIRRNQ